MASRNRWRQSPMGRNGRRRSWDYRAMSNRSRQTDNFRSKIRLKLEIQSRTSAGSTPFASENRKGLQLTENDCPQLRPWWIWGYFFLGKRTSGLQTEPKCLTRAAAGGRLAIPSFPNLRASPNSAIGNIVPVSDFYTQFLLMKSSPSGIIFAGANALVASNEMNAIGRMNPKIESYEIPC